MGFLKSIARIFRVRSLAGQPMLRPEDPCWCGSGKNYKECHYDMDNSGQAKDTALARRAAMKG